jgi:type II secretory pathway component PulF
MKLPNILRIDAAMEITPRIIGSLWPIYTTAVQQRSLMRLLAVATERQLPLRPLLEAHAIDERGIQRRRLWRLLRLWADDTPLLAALEQVPGLLREEDLLAIRFGTQSGILPASIRSAIEQAESVAPQNDRPYRKSFAYFAVVGAILLLGTWFLQRKIVPAIYKILGDYSTEPPASLQASQILNWWLSSGLFWGVVAVLLLIFAVPGPINRVVRNSILGRFWRPLRQLRAADLLQKISLASDAGRPLAGVLSTLARYHYDPAIRHKLLFVRNEVEQGANLWQSMAAVGLLTRPEERALQAADKLHNRDWTLSHLALNKRDRTLRRIERSAEWAFPAVVFGLGLFVLVQSLAVFGPLTKLILGLS